MGTKLGRDRAEAQTQTQDKRTYRFQLGDHETWLQHLRERGYVVVTAALSSAEVHEARELLWQDLTKVYPGLAQGDSGSLSAMRLSRPGLVANLAQCAGAWHVRGSLA